MASSAVASSPAPTAGTTSVAAAAPGPPDGSIRSLYRGLDSDGSEFPDSVVSAEEVKKFGLYCNWLRAVTADYRGVEAFKQVLRAELKVETSADAVELNNLVGELDQEMTKVNSKYTYQPGTHQSQRYLRSFAPLLTRATTTIRQSPPFACCGPIAG